MLVRAVIGAIVAAVYFVWMWMDISGKFDRFERWLESNKR